MNRRADRAWQKAEIHLGEGHVGDPGRGRQAFRKYVEERWLPNHMLEPTTREKYTYYLYAHIIPELGPIRMIDIFPEQIREWISKMQRSGQSAWTIQYCKSSILNSIFTTALNDQVTYIHPCRGVKTPSVPATPRTIVTPEQFNAIYQALPDADTRLLIETAIESGLRWGELTEMRVKDLDFATRMLTVCRKVAELNTQFHPDGKRFLVKDYPKDKEVPAAEAQPADRHQAQGSRRCQGPGTRRVAVRAAATGVATRPACCRRSGDARAHGVKRLRPKVSAWHSQRLQRGRCRCEYCRGAFAEYRARRRAAANNAPRHARVADDDEHIGRNWFRRSVWYPACAAADLGMAPRVHDLRHAHASWLLAGGADLQVVKERLGHASIVTTQRCPAFQ